MLELVLRLRISVEDLGTAAPELRLQVAHGIGELADVGGRAARVLLDGARRVEQGLLLQEADARPARERNVPEVRLVAAGRDAQQGRLAGPVRTDEPCAIAARKAERNVLEEDAIGESLRYRLDGEDRQGLRLMITRTLCRTLSSDTPRDSRIPEAMPSPSRTSPRRMCPDPTH